MNQFTLTECVPVCAVTLTELLETYIQHKQTLCRQDRDKTKTAFRLLAECFPNADTADFSARKLLEFQDYLIKLARFCRDYINKLINFVRAVFNWGVLFELVSPTLSYSLKHVPPVRYGAAKENNPREDVPDESIAAVLLFLPLVVVDMKGVAL